jgi:hypothetical protein
MLTPPAPLPFAAKPLAWTVSGPHVDGKHVAVMATVVWATAYVEAARKRARAMFFNSSLPINLIAWGKSQGPCCKS